MASAHSKGLERMIERRITLSLRRCTGRHTGLCIKSAALKSRKSCTQEPFQWTSSELRVRDDALPRPMPTCEVEYKMEEFFWFLNQHLPPASTQFSDTTLSSQSCASFPFFRLLQLPRLSSLPWPYKMTLSRQETTQQSSLALRTVSFPANFVRRCSLCFLRHPELWRLLPSDRCH